MARSSGSATYTPTSVRVINGKKNVSHEFYVYVDLGIITENAEHVPVSWFLRNKRRVKYGRRGCTCASKEPLTADDMFGRGVVSSVQHEPHFIHPKA